MKNLHYRSIICTVFTIALFLHSCSKNEDNKSQNLSDGILQIKLKASDHDIVKSGLKIVPVTDFNVTIYTHDDLILKEYEHFSDVPSKITLSPGKYYVIAHSGNDSTATFNNPYYYGKSEVFDIGSGTLSSVNVICNMKNFAVNVSYNENIPKYFIDYFTVVKTETDSLIFLKDEKRNGYFSLQPVYIYSQLFYKLEGDNAGCKVIEKGIPDPEEGHLYQIVVDASTENLQTGITINIDDQMDTSIIQLTDYLNINELSQGDLLITEIMYDPTSLSDSYGEWFEIYNNTGGAINIENLVLFQDDASHIINKKIILTSRSSYVMAKTDSAYNGESYVYSGLNFTNTSDDISLYTFGTNGNDGILLSRVEYDENAGFPSGSGESIHLSADCYDFYSAQIASSWCLSTNQYNTGDLGSPGIINPLCE